MNDEDSKINQDSINKLIPALNKYLEVSTLDRKETKDMMTDFKIVIKEVEENSFKTRMNIAKMVTQFSMYRKSTDEHRKGCERTFDSIDKTFGSIDQSIKIIPSEKMMIIRDEKTEKLEKKMEKITPMYKTIAAGILLLTGLAGWFSTTIIKKIIG